MCQSVIVEPNSEELGVEGSSDIDGCVKSNLPRNCDRREPQVHLLKVAQGSTEENDAALDFAKETWLQAMSSIDKFVLNLPVIVIYAEDSERTEESQRETCSMKRPVEEAS